MAAPGRVAKGFIVELDGLRGIAILLVMVHRFWPRTGVGVAADVAGAGWVGVDLFFVISGFLITGILLDTRDDAGYFRNFYARRVLRIFPLYYLFVGAVLLAFAGNAAFRENAGSPLWYLAHLGNVLEGLLDKDVPYWLAPVWSLAIEEQFYLTFPLLVRALDPRRLTIALIAMIAAAPMLRLGTTLAFPDHERVQYLFTACRIDTIAAGCLLAVLVRTPGFEQRRRDVLRIAVAVLPVVVMLAIASRLDRTSPFDRVFGYSVVALGCASVVALVLLARGKPATAMLRFPALRYLGKLCFGLYLLHRPADTIVSALAVRVGFEGDLWLIAPKLGVAVVLATISWRLIERPFLSLKDRFASAHHPGGTAEPTRSRLAGTLAALLHRLGLWSIVLVLLSCRGPAAGPSAFDARASQDASLDVDSDAPALSEVDAAPTTGTVLYREGVRHSPIAVSGVARLQAIAAARSRQARVFAKVGDSITASPDFMSCFDGTQELGTHGELAPTVTFFAAGDADGASPFARASLSAIGGATAVDILAANPCRFDREVAAIDPRFAVVMFGTNEIRYGWSLDEAAGGLWDLVDTAIARGVIPILSTIPPNPGDPDADARIPTFDRFVRAIAQGRGVPLIDLHREFELLPDRGISADRLHPSTAPGGGCVLTDAGLRYGYNLRNLVVLEALARTRAALAGIVTDTAAPTRAGAGTLSDPFVLDLPDVDLRDTHEGAASTAAACPGEHAGRAVVYRVTMTSATRIAARVVDRGGVDANVHILVGSECLASGDHEAHAVVGPGPAWIVVDAPSPAREGEFALAVEQDL